MAGGRAQSKTWQQPLTTSPEGHRRAGENPNEGLLRNSHLVPAEPSAPVSRHGTGPSEPQGAALQTAFQTKGVAAWVWDILWGSGESSLRSHRTYCGMFRGEKKKWDKGGIQVI